MWPSPSGHPHRGGFSSGRSVFPSRSRRWRSTPASCRSTASRSMSPRRSPAPTRFTARSPGGRTPKRRRCTGCGRTWWSATFPRSPAPPPPARGFRPSPSGTSPGTGSTPAIPRRRWRRPAWRRRCGTPMRAPPAPCGCRCTAVSTLSTPWSTRRWWPGGRPGSPATCAGGSAFRPTGYWRCSPSAATASGPSTGRRWRGRSGGTSSSRPAPTRAADRPATGSRRWTRSTWPARAWPSRIWSPPSTWS